MLTSLLFEIHSLLIPHESQPCPDRGICIKEAVNHAGQGHARRMGHSEVLTNCGPLEEETRNPLQYSCCKNPMNNMKRQKTMTLEDEPPRSEGVQYVAEMR